MTDLHGRFFQIAGRHQATLTTAFVYFISVFTVAFVAGALRATVVAPLLGATSAVLIEVPVLLLLSWAIARHLLRARRFDLGERLTMGLMVFAWTMTAEVVLSMAIWGRSARQWVETVGTPLGLVGLAGQIAFAAIPLLVQKSESPEAAA